MNLYPNSGKMLKKAVRILNPLGYLLSDLLGIAAGTVVGLVLYPTNMNSFLTSLICVLTAGAVAALPIFGVWLSGLVMWNISDASEDARKVSQQMAK